MHKGPSSLDKLLYRRMKDEDYNGRSLWVTPLQRMRLSLSQVVVIPIEFCSSSRGELVHKA